MEKVKEIKEGDIVEYFSNDSLNGFVGKVKWINPKGKFLIVAENGKSLYARREQLKYAGVLGNLSIPA